MPVEGTLGAEHLAADGARVDVGGGGGRGVVRADVLRQRRRGEQLNLTHRADVLLLRVCRFYWQNLQQRFACDVNSGPRQPPGVRTKAAFF